MPPSAFPDEEDRSVSGVDRRSGTLRLNLRRSRLNRSTVMAGLGPAIHVFPPAVAPKAWIPGPSPGMTVAGRDG